MLQPTALATNLIADPLIARDKLRRDCVLAIAASHDIVNDHIQNGNLTAEEAETYTQQFLTGPLIGNMPYTSKLPTNTAKMMELGMSMALILNNDYAETS